MEEHREAFISILTSDDFLEGLLVTYRSLRKYSKKKYVVLVDLGVSEQSIQIIKRNGIQVLKGDDILLPDLADNTMKDRWYKTLFKIRVFGLTQFERLVYLDSDLLICGEIDELFEKESISAVPDRVFLSSYGRKGMNAGLMCIQPSKELEQSLIELIPLVANRMEVFGDQDVINEYFSGWEEEKSKHLDVKYNACFYELDKYEEKEIRVVHFIFGEKPWMWTKLKIAGKRVKYFLYRRWKQYHYLNLYMKYLSHEEIG